MANDPGSAVAVVSLGLSSPLALFSNDALRPPAIAQPFATRRLLVALDCHCAHSTQYTGFHRRHRVHVPVLLHVRPSFAVLGPGRQRTSHPLFARHPRASILLDASRSATRQPASRRSPRAMAAPAFIHAFKALQTTAARSAAIDALANELSPYEWRQLRALVLAKTFHFDIVASLPPELVFHIFRYLDISTPFRLQTVSCAAQCNASPVLHITNLVRRTAWYLQIHSCAKISAWEPIPTASPRPCDSSHPMLLTSLALQPA